MISDGRSSDLFYERNTAHPRCSSGAVFPALPHLSASQLSFSNQTPVFSGPSPVEDPKNPCSIWRHRLQKSARHLQQGLQKAKSVFSCMRRSRPPCIHLQPYMELKLLPSTPYCPSLCSTKLKVEGDGWQGVLPGRDGDGPKTEDAAKTAKEDRQDGRGWEKGNIHPVSRKHPQRRLCIKGKTHHIYPHILTYLHYANNMSDLQSKHRNHIWNGERSLVHRLLAPKRLS
jgi:hypothetical protein